MIDPAVEHAYAYLRGHTRADMRFDEHFRPVKYIIAADGRLVAPVMVAMLQSFDTVLFIPEVTEGAMEVQVSLDQFEEHGEHAALTDRWRIHHGEPDDVRWAFLSIDAVRIDETVIDGEALMRPNPLADDEARICRHMNESHQADLARLCRHISGVGVEDPVMVAIDPQGVDVRGTFAVYRVPAPEPMETAEDARRVLTTMSETAQQAEEDELAS